MNRWRLMNTSCNRFKILHVKNPRIQISVPAHNVKRMVFKGIVMKTILLFNPDLKLSLLFVHQRVFGQTKITLTEWAVLHKLSHMVQITVWKTDRTSGINYQHASFSCFEYNPIGSSARNVDVVKGFEC